MTEHSELLPNLLDEDAFEVQMRGYSRRQVDEFVARSRSQTRDLEERLARALDESEQLRQQLSAAHQQPGSRPPHEEISERIAQILKLADDEATAQKARANEEINKLRSDAQREADAALTEAREKAERMLTSAQEPGGEFRLHGTQRGGQDTRGGARRGRADRQPRRVRKLTSCSRPPDPRPNGCSRKAPRARQRSTRRSAQA